LTKFIVHRENARKKLGEGETTAMAVIAMESTGKDKPRSQPVQFDTDSMTVGVNNRCTACISDRREHFVGELTPNHQSRVRYHTMEMVGQQRVRANV
jgi:hypothetical protein